MHIINNSINTKNVENYCEEKIMKRREIKEVALTTYESYPIKTLLQLKHYLNIQPTGSSVTRKLKKVKKLLSLFKKGDELRKGVIDSIHEFGYHYFNNRGRIYSNTSMAQSIPKDLRFIIFGKEYLDVDIVNSHPTILLEFCYENKVETEALELLVKNRNLFYDTIQKELKSEIKDIKRTVHIQMNLKTETLMNKSTKSPTLNTLILEVIKIRALLEDFVRQTDPEYYKEMKASNKSIQTLYCFTVESKYLMSLYRFLEKKLEEKAHFKDIYANKKYSIKDLSFIPFFDGALIKHRNYRVRNKIPELIEEFNSNSNLVKFAIKEFEFNSSVINLTDFNKFRKVYDTLENVSLPKIVKHLNLELDLINREEKEKFIDDRKKRHNQKEKISKMFRAVTKKTKRQEYKLLELSNSDMITLKEEVDLSVFHVNTENRSFKFEGAKEVTNRSMNIFEYSGIKFASKEIEEKTLEGLKLALESAINKLPSGNHFIDEEFQYLINKSEILIAKIYKSLMPHADSLEVFLADLLPKGDTVDYGDYFDNLEGNDSSDDSVVNNDFDH